MPLDMNTVNVMGPCDLNFDKILESDDLLLNLDNVSASDLIDDIRTFLASSMNDDQVSNDSDKGLSPGYPKCITPTSILKDVDMMIVEQKSIEKLIKSCIALMDFERVNDAGTILDYLATLRPEKELYKIEPRLEAIRCKIDRFKYLDNRLMSEDGWVLHVERPDLRVYYAQQEGKNLISFRFDGLIENASPQSILAVMYELDLFNGWTPFYRFPMKMGLMEAGRTKFIGPNLDFIGRLAVALPWPMHNRDVYLTCYGCDDFRRSKRVIIGLENSNASNPVERLGGVKPNEIEELKEFKRFDINGGVVVQVISPTCVKMQLVWDVDLKMSIPSSVINFFSKMMLAAGFDEMRSHILRVEGKNSTPQRNKPGEKSLGADPVPDAGSDTYQKRINDPKDPFYALVRNVLSHVRYDEFGNPYSLQEEPEAPSVLHDKHKLEAIAEQLGISVDDLLIKLKAEEDFNQDALEQEIVAQKQASSMSSDFNENNNVNDNNNDDGNNIKSITSTPILGRQSISHQAIPSLSLILKKNSQNGQSANMNVSAHQSIVDSGVDNYNNILQNSGRTQLSTNQPQTSFAVTKKQKKKSSGSCCACRSSSKKDDKLSLEEKKRRLSVNDPLDKEVEIIRRMSSLSKSNKSIKVGGNK